MLTFAQLLEETKPLTHPSGVPENLEVPYRRSAENALLDLQRDIDCLKHNHEDGFRFCATYWHCKMSVIPAPYGEVKRVYTANALDRCDRVYYRQVSYDQILCLAQRLCAVTPPDQSGKPALPTPFLYPDPSTDRNCGRSRYGFYAIHHERIYFAPWIHSGEIVVIEWDGNKQRWGDDDSIHEDLDVERAVKLFIQSEFARDYNCNPEKRPEYVTDYLLARSDVYHECRKRTRIREAELCTPAPCDVSCVTKPAATSATASDEECPATVFAFIADYGKPTNGTAESDVAALVRNWEPEFIVTGSDNIYAPTNNYEDAVGAFYGDYITDNVSTNRFWPSIGNHDHSDPANGIQDYYDYFGALPGNKRYYDIVRGGIHWFILHPRPQEPDGTSATSIQAEWLRVMLAVSQVPWKIVVAPCPPKSSANNGDYPGIADADWPYGDWGADLVLSGDAHDYEHLEFGGLPYIIGGWGGASLDNVFIPLAESVIRYGANYGGIKGEVTPTTLTLKAYNIEGALIDKVELTKP